MQDIVNSALENAEAEDRELDADLDGDGAEFGDPRIVIVGCGGAGNNTVNRLYNIGVDGAETIAINTDKQHLQMVEADTKILVGKSLTNGLGAGGDPSMGERATEMAQGTIKEVLGEADLVFVTAGMGGGTGTGAAPVISKIAKDQGAIVVDTMPTTIAPCSLAIFETTGAAPVPVPPPMPAVTNTRSASPSTSLMVP